jgi:hypothetical protein
MLLFEIGSHSVVAKAVTLVMFSAYRKIDPSELHNGGRDSEGNNIVSAPYITEMSGIFNRLSNLMIEAILMTKEDPIVAFEWCILFAKAFLKLRNFEGLAACISALNHTSIRRLKFLWDGLSSKSKKTWKAMEELMSPRNNFYNYTNALKNASPPFLPWVSPKVREIRALYDRNAKFLPNGEIDMSAMMGISISIRDFLRFQSHPYTFSWIDKSIIKKLLEKPSIDEEVFYKTSLQLLPSKALEENSVSPLQSPIHSPHQSPIRLSPPMFSSQSLSYNHKATPYTSFDANYGMQSPQTLKNVGAAPVLQSPWDGCEVDLGFMGEPTLVYDGDKPKSKALTPSFSPKTHPTECEQRPLFQDESGGSLFMGEPTLVYADTESSKKKKMTRSSTSLICENDTSPSRKSFKQKTVTQYSHSTSSDTLSNLSFDSFYSFNKDDVERFSKDTPLTSQFNFEFSDIRGMTDWFVSNVKKQEGVTFTKKAFTCLTRFQINEVYFY